MSDPEIIIIDNAQDVLSRATRVAYTCYVRHWETIQGRQGDVPSLAEARERLLKFAGSAALDDGSAGPAPYAECVAQAADGSTTIVMYWGTDPADAP